MKIYAETSFLGSLYLHDANSSPALNYMARYSPTLPLTQFGRLELKNAIERAIHQNQVRAEDAKAAWHLVNEDLRDGTLLHHTLNWTEFFREAERLVTNHTAKNGTRILDIMHVAAALTVSAEIFLSFDDRQIKLAKATGLKIGP